MLDGLQLRLRIYRGGTFSWTHPCSWTQRQLSIKVIDPVRIVHSVSAPLFVLYVCNKWKKKPFTVHIKEKIFYFNK